MPDAIARGTTADPPQTALENWSNANNVFQFVRVEDMAYDPDDPRVVYFADTGSTRLREDPATGRLFRAAAADVPYFNTDGRLFRMVLNEDDPTVVDELSIVAQGLLAEQLTNPAPPATPTFNVIDPGVGFRAPDNLDISQREPHAPGGREQRQDLALGPRVDLDPRRHRHPSDRAGGRGVERDHRHERVARAGLVGAGRPVARQPGPRARRA